MLRRIHCNETVSFGHQLTWLTKNLLSWVRRDRLGFVLFWVIIAPLFLQAQQELFHHVEFRREVAHLLFNDPPGLFHGDPAKSCLVGTFKNILVPNGSREIQVETSAHYESSCDLIERLTLGFLYVPSVWRKTLVSDGNFFVHIRFSWRIYSRARNHSDIDGGSSSRILQRYVSSYLFKRFVFGEGIERAPFYRVKHYGSYPDPGSLLISRNLDTGIQPGLTLLLAKIESLLRYFLRPIHRAGEPVEIVDSLPHLVSEFLPTAFHLSESPSHNAKLAAIDIQSPDSYDSQHHIYSKRQNFEHPEFRFRNLGLLCFGYLFGFTGHLSFFYSGLRWRRQRRVLIGTGCWMVAVLLIIHAFRLIYELPLASVMVAL